MPYKKPVRPRRKRQIVSRRLKTELNSLLKMLNKRLVWHKRKQLEVLKKLRSKHSRLSRMLNRK